jgi:hypothetical protein
LVAFFLIRVHPTIQQIAREHIIVTPIPTQRKWLSILASVALVPLGAGASHAAEKPSPRLVEAYQQFNQGMGGRAQRFAILSQLFSSLDRNGDGISPSELDRAEMIAGASMRASNASMKLIYDLNGDMKVTQKEIETVLELNANLLQGDRKFLKAQMAVRQRTNIQNIMKADANKNGAIEGTELLTPRAVERSGGIGGFANRQHELARALLAADPNSDNLVTEEEAFALVSSIPRDIQNPDSLQLALPPRSP